MIPATALVCAAGLLVWQRADNARLAREIAALRGAGSEAAVLLGENARLEADLPRPETVAALRDDRQALVRLRAQLDAIRATDRLQGNKQSVEHLVPLSALTHAGLATPQAALETALWAGTNGHVDVLASVFVFENREVRARAEHLLGELPAQIKGRYRSPEHLIAAMALPDMKYVEVGAVRLIDLGESRLEKVREDEADTGAVAEFTMDFREFGKEPRRKTWFLYQKPAGWKVAIPQVAVEFYAERILREGDIR